MNYVCIVHELGEPDNEYKMKMNDSNKKYPRKINCIKKIKTKFVIHIGVIRSIWVIFAFTVYAV